MPKKATSVTKQVTHRNKIARVKDERRRQIFLETLKTNGGNVSKALAAAQLPRKTAYYHFNTDPEFSQQWLDALEIGYDELWEEARHRATEGDKVVTSNRDGSMTVEYRKSDTLLIFLMKQGEAQKKWRNRIIQAGNIALETVRTAGEEQGLTNEQIEAIQNVMTQKFEAIQLI